MGRPSQKILQGLIDDAVLAHNAVHYADAELYAYCKKLWEFDTMPDEIVDGCMGGCGRSRGMLAKDFIEAMNFGNGLDLSFARK